MTFGMIMAGTLSLGTFTYGAARRGTLGTFGILGDPKPVTFGIFGVLGAPKPVTFGGLGILGEPKLGSLTFGTIMAGTLTFDTFTCGAFGIFGILGDPKPGTF